MQIDCLHREGFQPSIFRIAQSRGEQRPEQNGGGFSRWQNLLQTIGDGLAVSVR